MRNTLKEKLGQIKGEHWKERTREREVISTSKELIGPEPLRCTEKCLHITTQARVSQLASVTMYHGE